MVDRVCRSPTWCTSRISQRTHDGRPRQGRTATRSMGTRVVVITSTDTSITPQTTRARPPAMALAAGTSIRALDGFFRLHYSCEVPAPTPVMPAPHLFSSFVLDTNSWEELEKKRQLLETSSSTSEHASEGSHVKIVYFVRHAEGYHNVAERELGTARWEAVEAKQEKFLDADLTPFGINDAQSKGPPAVAIELAKGMPPVERVIVSPMSRAIQTAENFFTSGQGPRPFVAMELCRETLGIHTCDKRRPLYQIKEKFADVDFSRIRDEEDAMWQPNHRETDDELRARTKEFLVQLFDEVEERHVAVVTHSGFMSSVWSLFYGEPFKAANCEVVPLALQKL